MPESPIYAEHYCSERSDRILRWLSLDWDRENGETDSPFGHFSIGEITRSEIAEFVSAEGDPWLSEARNFGPGWYMVQINNDGLVFGHFFRDERRALADFNRMNRLYNEWLDDVEIFDYTSPAGGAPDGLGQR